MSAISYKDNYCDHTSYNTEQYKKLDNIVLYLYNCTDRYNITQDGVKFMRPNIGGHMPLSQFYAFLVKNYQ